METQQNPKSTSAQDVQAWLVAHVAEVLGVDPGELDVRQPFEAFGLSSREAVTLSGDLQDWLGRRLPPTMVWQYPTIEALSRHLAAAEPGQAEPQPGGDGGGPGEGSGAGPVAIIGIGCRFPGADGPEAFWRLLREGVDSIIEVPAERWRSDEFYDSDPLVPGKMSTRWGGFMEHIDQFDSEFFGISPREAARMDPQQRLLLEVAWSALEDAGQDMARLAGTRTGVFVGVCGNEYSRLQLDHPDLIDAYAGTGNALSIAANRLSYFFDFRGPSFALDTACSSSLVAVHLACASLARGECDLALAGGANLILSPALGITFSKAGAMAADGRCKTFDARADGYVRSEGVGLIVLKPLTRAVADRDPIYAVIRGSAINQDGRTNGLMAPNPQAQEAVVREACRRAGISPGQIQYVEAHGTGTLLGDPIEARALGAVLSGGRLPGDCCIVGSVKTNIGHLEAAAGVAGLIKVALSLTHGAIPPSLHFETPNPHIPFADLPLRVQTSLTSWPATPGPHLAGVSSFGFGGTNAHVIVEQAPPAIPAGGEEEPEQGVHLLPLSARSSEALHALARAYRDFLLGDLSEPAAWRDISYTASVRRSHHDFRLAISGRSRQDWLDSLEAYLRGETRPGMSAGRRSPGRPLRLAFVFPGQGAQWAGMARELIRDEPVFREMMERLDRSMQPYLGRSLLKELETDPLNRLGQEACWLDRIDRVQPALFAVEVGLAALWRSWGVEPDAVVGHSMGEVAAALVSGALSLEDATRVICYRSQLLQRTSGQGAMLAVGLSLSEAQPELAGFDGHACVAVSNSSSSTVVSGEPGALAELAERLQQRGILCRPVKVDVAAHSPQVEPLCPELIRALEGVQPRRAAVPFYSTVTGEPGQDLSLDADYWARNLRQPVLFSNAVQRMAADGLDVFVEMSPHPLLLHAIQEELQGHHPAGTVLPSMRRQEPERATMLASLGALYTLGYPVDWRRSYPEGGRCVPLPPYPWQRQRHWLNTGGMATGPVRTHPVRKEESPPVVPLEHGLYQLRWCPAPLRPDGPSGTDARGTWVIYADRQGIGEVLASRLQAQGGHCLLVLHGETFEPVDAGRARIRPESAEDARRLFEEALGPDRLPCRGVVHLWSLDSPPASALTASSLQAAQTLGCGSVLHLLQGLDRAVPPEPPPLWLVTQGAQSVEPDTSSGAMAQSPVWGLGRTLALEHPTLWGGLVDLDPESDVMEAAAVLAGELCRRDGEDQLAFRSGRRYVARLASLGRPGGAASALSWRTDASYLITGGLGDLGLQVARWMVEQGARRLVLIGRTGLPRRAEWTRIEPGSRTARCIAAVRELEALGASVHLAALDVADEARLASFLEDFRLEGWPPIRGVIHMAGVVQPEMLRQLDLPALQAVLRPKVLGGWLLHRLLEDAPLDFFVLFSSAAAVLNSPFLGSYAAANAFLDALAHTRRAEGRPGLSINWGFWSGAGMAARYQQDTGRELVPRGMQAFAPPQGLEALRYLMQQDLPPQVAVMPVDWKQWSTFHPAAGTLPLLSDLICAATPAADQASNGRGARAAAPEQVDRLQRGGPSKGEELRRMPPGERPAMIESYLRQLLSQVLYLSPDRIEADGNLLDLGLDSMMAMELIRGVERDLQLRLYPREVFERPSLGVLAAYLATELERGSGAIPGPRQATVSSAQALAALVQRGPRGAPAKPVTRNPGVVFLLSGPRSGSTLLRVMLAGHPALFCPPELHLLPFEGMRERQERLGQSYLDEGLTRAFMELMDLDAEDGKGLVDDLAQQDLPIQDVYAKLQALAGTRLLVDKSPSYAASRETLARAERLFDGARYIHLVRHPYAVIESSVRLRVDKLLDAGDVDPYDFAEQVWAKSNGNVLDLRQQIDSGRYHRVRYEDLARDPEGTARELCRFLGIPFDAALLKPYEGNRMTDGLHAISMGTGDPNFLSHQRIEPELGEAWRKIRLPRPLGAFARRIAAELEYELPQEEVAAQGAPAAETDSGPVSPLVLIQPQGSRRPIFFVHPASGIIYPYYELARALGQERPFYALQDPSLEGTREPYSSLEEYAQEYIRVIRAVQPEGPYLLGGWSFGGTVAVEMARELHQAGQQVALLVAVDSESPLGNRQLPLKQRLTYYKDKAIEYITLAPGLIPYLLDAVYLLTFPTEDRTDSNMTAMDYLRWAWSDRMHRYLERQAGMARVIARAQSFLEIQPPTRSVRRGLYIFRRQLSLINNFRPRPYPGRLTLFRAEQQIVRKFHHDPLLGWGDIVQGGVEVIPVPGNHMVLFQEPYIHTIAERLKECIEQAEAGIGEGGLAR